MKTPPISRREFIAKSGMATAGATLGVNALSAQSPGHRGANDKIRMGFIGIGNRGSQLLPLFMRNPDVEIAALCDIYEPYASRDRAAVHPRYLDLGMVPRMGEAFGREVKRYSDFRKMLEQKDIDAVCIATPDHWHAIQAIRAMEAGKDVYVEKPLTITIQEGRAMVEAQKRTGRVCAVGLNRRGASIYQALAKEVPGGLIGKVTTARALRISNMFPDGIGRMKAEAPPAGLDWNMWLGPRPYRDYQYNIAPYSFRWWSEYSSQMGNWGVHYMDAIRWLMGETAPVAITAHGGKYAVNDDRDIPDTMEVLFEFDSGSMIQFSIHEASSGGGIPGGEIELNGSKGTLIASEDGFRVIPARPGQFQTWEKLVDEMQMELEGGQSHGDLQIKEDSTANLVNDFVECMKSGREPLCTLEDGHRSTTFAHLANIALAMNTRLEWDPVAERITNNERANDLLHYQYREPWTL
ncbi:MAG: Gfo/Idh/MocA family oxidoreductase [Bacteroidia bacterium]|nr:MAG: Gfo/Idh/MocA family oxidoreductase [Bacteroidia bacterium]